MHCLNILGTTKMYVGHFFGTAASCSLHIDVTAFANLLHNINMGLFALKRLCHKIKLTIFKSLVKISLKVQKRIEPDLNFKSWRGIN